jgi:hypothetical protein
MPDCLWRLRRTIALAVLFAPLVPASGLAGDLPAEGDGGVAVAAHLLKTEIDAGLGARMIETWRGLTDSLRGRLLAASPDLPLDLITAHLLAGDTQGAAALEAALSPAPPEPPAPWLAPAQRESGEARDLRLRRGLFARWLRPSPDDPFPLLTQIVSVSDRSPAPNGFFLLLGRLAEREGYPAIASFAFGVIAQRLGRAAKGTESPDLLELRREVDERSATTSQAVPPPIPGAVAAVELLMMDDGPTPPFFSKWRIQLFVADRAGRRVFVIWNEGPPRGPQGGQFRLEESGGVWSGISVGAWIA